MRIEKEASASNSINPSLYIRDAKKYVSQHRN